MSTGIVTDGGRNNSHPLDNVVRTNSTNRGTVLEMQTGLFELGRNRAKESGTTEAIAADVQALVDHAQAMARDTYRDAFDPSLNPSDAMHKAEYDRDVTARMEAEKGAAHALANLRDAEMKIARTPKAGPKPTANPGLLVAFVVAITVSISPTLHDRVFHGLDDDILAWFISVLFSAFVASMLTVAILSGRRTSVTWIGVAAGVILGIGLGAVRLSSANGWPEVLFAAGLTIVEIASVLLLEWLASGLRNSEARWEQMKTAEDEAVNTHGATQTDLSRWQASLHELASRISGRIAMVEDRQNRNIHLAELEVVAVKAVRDGYSAGIAENVGRLRAAGRSIQ